MALKPSMHKDYENAIRIISLLDSSRDYERSREDIQDILGLTDKQYENASELAVKSGDAIHNKGRNGGLRLR